MPLAHSHELPLHVWMPCYPAPTMHLGLEPDGLHVTTIPTGGGYAVKYPILKARVASEVTFRIRYRPEAGDLVFGALSGDESRWLSTSGAADTCDDGFMKTFRLQLEAREKFVLLVANAHPAGDVASRFVVASVDVSGIAEDEMCFGSSGDDEQHHYVMSRFPCPSIAVPARCSAYFVGGIFRDFLFTGEEGSNPERTVAASYPPFDNEYFEWVALLSAALAARDRFTMIELGAGYGRWSIMAAGAARRRNLPFTLISMEAEPTHFKWMEMCFRDNNLDPAEHQLLEAAVSATEGDVWFHVGQPQDWYGQHIALPSELPAGGVDTAVATPTTFKKVRAVTLASILEPLDEVDLIDIDIQGAEAEVLAASVEQLHAKVKMLSIGTHVHPRTYSLEIHDEVTRILTAMKWVCIFHYAPGATADTPYGRITFDDGVQVWVNPRATRTLDVIQHP